MSTIVRDNRPVFVILRREYFDLTNDFCAAKLIEYFLNWTNWKMRVHRTPWIYQPLERIRYDLIGEHSLHAIRRAIKLLEEMGLLERRHNPGNGQDKTWQYKLDVDLLDKLLKDRTLRNEGSAFTVEQHHRSNPIEPDPNNNVAVEEELSEETWEEFAREVEKWEREILQQEMELISSSDQLIPQEDQFSQEDLDPLPRVIVTTNFPGAIAISSVPQDQVPAVSPSQPSPSVSSPVPPAVKPQPVVPQKLTQAEIDRVEKELQKLKIDPEPCRGIVQRYWQNVQGAIARVKEALEQNWCSNPTGLFIASCKKGVKPKKPVVEHRVSEWFNWARSKRIVIGMSGDIVYTPDGYPLNLWETMDLYPLTE
jgi:hypothetical protein